MSEYIKNISDVVIRADDVNRLNTIYPLAVLEAACVATNAAIQAGRVLSVTRRFSTATKDLQGHGLRFWLEEGSGLMAEVGILPTAAGREAAKLENVIINYRAIEEDERDVVDNVLVRRVTKLRISGLSLQSPAMRKWRM